MSDADDLEHIRQLLVSAGGRPPTAMRVAVEQIVEPPATWGALRAQLTSGASGWVTTPSVVVALEAGEWRPVHHGALPEDGAPILGAEVALDDRTTLVVRHMGAEARAWRITEGAGEPAVRVDRSYLSTERDGDGRRRLLHHVFWREQDGVLAPFVSRFVGWKEA